MPGAGVVASKIRKERAAAQSAKGGKEGSNIESKRIHFNVSCIIPVMYVHYQCIVQVQAVNSVASGNRIKQTEVNREDK